MNTEKRVLPYGSKMEIARRLQLSATHVSRCLSGERVDPRVELEARKLEAEGWRHPRQPLPKRAKGPKGVVVKGTVTSAGGLKS